MKIICNIPSVFLAVIASSFACAGSDPASSSNVNGYFLGFLNKAYLSPDHSAEYMREIKAVCDKKGELWALGVKSPFQCKSLSYLEEGGDGPVFEIVLAHKVSIKAPNHALLFSVRPFAKATWSVRHATKLEIAELIKNIVIRKKYRDALGKIRSGKAEVIEPFNGKLMAYIIPWKTSSDGIVDEKDYIIAIRHRNGAYEITESRGTIIGYADLDGDGIPEIQQSMECDGRCESVFSIAKGHHPSIEISNH